ncbi:hypothetical protein L6452_38812 [Arctium lappa]|uniref:Uncharacterized protein n=1 Tax=Arctium lappa TaxID=4217 RepID=A0ACB8XQK6_ARCLA|nr:hypothetical protein L6452_38812 [Arctium lappa]
MERFDTLWKEGKVEPEIQDFQRILRCFRYQAMCILKTLKICNFMLSTTEGISLPLYFIISAIDTQIGDRHFVPGLFVDVTAITKGKSFQVRRSSERLYIILIVSEEKPIKLVLR